MIDDPVLLNDWHVVARSSDAGAGRVLAARLLGQDLGCGGTAVAIPIETVFARGETYASIVAQSFPAAASRMGAWFAPTMGGIMMLRADA